MLASCVSQNLTSESGLYDVKLSHTYKAAIDGAWTWGKGNPFAHQKKGAMYVAPLNVDAIRKNHSELATSMVGQMHSLIKQELSQAFAEANAANHTQWGLTDNPAQADLRVNLAVVSLRTQNPGLTVASTVVGTAASIPGLSTAVGQISKGDITIEGTIRNNHNGQLLVAFKDSNRAHLRFYHKDTYRKTGNVDANLKEWAEGLAKLCREGAYDRLGDGTMIDKVENRSWWSALIEHLF